MYMPAAVAEMVNPGINPFRKKSNASETDKVQAIEEWIAQHGREPSVAIGLQACRISWDDGEHFYEAGTPWQRYNVALTNCTIDDSCAIHNGVCIGQDAFESEDRQPCGNRSKHMH
ncbi:hypothetical protein ACH5RR_017636 [Cinchona calisaya]|uniref:Uncharacterized protein n=1 Tax=Cinchona calisaya TaxID=153742 RepID=A0ABD2ZM26_9GENT